ncbi:MAG: hypothetical protein LAO06_05520, partial [Acidobacteriia bacterium]|nr:hypothetical protein [Terriglobia bacterium]
MGATETDTGLSARLTVAVFVGSARDVAVIVTAAALAIIEGAAYTPLSLMVPHADVQPERPQVTAVSDALVTVAVNWYVSEAPR